MNERLEVQINAYCDEALEIRGKEETSFKNICNQQLNKWVMLILHQSQNQNVKTRKQQSSKDTRTRNNRVPSRV